MYTLLIAINGQGKKFVGEEAACKKKIFGEAMFAFVKNIMPNQGNSQQLAFGGGKLGILVRKLSPRPLVG